MRRRIGGGGSGNGGEKLAKMYRRNGNEMASMA
jgi:hypothetical protein